MNAELSSSMPILEWPHPILRSKAKPVTTFDIELEKQISRMWKTMYDAPGVGLAAPQVGDPRRIFIMDCSERVSKPRRLVCINPSIHTLEGELDSTEGCLSFPGLTVTTPRAAKVMLRAQTATGEWFELSLEGLEAVCAQHELDHLDGKSFLDRLSPLERLDALQSYADELEKRAVKADDAQTLGQVKKLIAEVLESLFSEDL